MWFVIRKLLVIIDDLDIVWRTVSPNETYPPLGIYADAVLAGAIALQGFQPVPRWRGQIRQFRCCIDHVQLSQRRIAKCLKGAHLPPGE